MKNHWIEFIKGIISVKATGKGIERFLNTLSRNGIIIWDVKRHGISSVTFKMRLNDVKKIRPAARSNKCKIEFLQRAGAPFLLKRMMKNVGFLIGFFAFLGLVILLSNMVWGIEIKGANPATEYQIRKELDKMEIKIGKLQFFAEDVEDIQKKLTNNIQAITWVGVELKGTKYHLQVVEKTEPNKSEYFSPRNLVAKKKAIISKMFIEEGQPVVTINELVKPGQLLVSGIIGKEGQTEIVPAKGEILGETWYKTDVVLPLKTTFQVFNGNEKQKYFIKISNILIPIWGFGKVEYQNVEVEEVDKKIKLLKWELPISFIHKTFRESEQFTRIYSNDEAIKEAKVMARKDIKNELSEDAIIKGEKVLHQSVDNGKVSVSMHFQIIENIAIEQPITQGD